ncbi:hypothetical protein AB0K00_09125 [Dactylosporangium sp. NPDC049525]|uniref:hypothetical protein n=1 Tax=Dactylosporangium sp. NPDC049525 TaxID=3154730 RepID=UPI00341FA850
MTTDPTDDADDLAALLAPGAPAAVRPRPRPVVPSHPAAVPAAPRPLAGTHFHPFAGVPVALPAADGLVRFDTAPGAAVHAVEAGTISSPPGDAVLRLRTAAGLEYGFHGVRPVVREGPVAAGSMIGAVTGPAVDLSIVDAAGRPVDAEAFLAGFADPDELGGVADPDALDEEIARDPQVRPPWEVTG